MARFQALAVDKAERVGRLLTIHEDYGFDVKGYLHLRNLFSSGALSHGP
jgi:hypothetical protein